MVLNKSDLAGESLDEVLEFTRRALAQALPCEVEVIPVSATRARAAQRAGGEDAEFALLDATLRRFVSESGRAARAASLRRRASSIVGRLDALASMRLSTLRMPMEERAQRRHALEQALQIVDDRARPLELSLDDDVARIQLRLEDRLDRMHDRDLSGFRANAERLASMRQRSERELLFEALLEAVIASWRTDAVAQAGHEMRECAQKYTRLAAEIEGSVWKAGLEAARLDSEALEPSAIAFAPGNLKLVASLEPTTGLELLIGFVTDVLPNPLRTIALRRRYDAMLERELDAARGKLRYSIARELDPWRRAVRATIRSALGQARALVLAAFDESSSHDEEVQAIAGAEDIRRRLLALRASVAVTDAISSESA